eukprot:TRINITY_DN93866_c0_g1_i1.p1 TRINITY_DN93866_c0_g1~~TRINITY_DN93866_c0_g1_i1.p1  ORF type:complete len:250 (+),score=41.78 TRINITY_DN93866_c0_g1_i1:96-845(+)
MQENSRDAPASALPSSEQVAQLTGCGHRDAQWYLEAAGGDVDLAVERISKMKAFSEASGSSERDAWWYMLRAEWNEQSAMSNLSAVRELSMRCGCSEGEAWKSLARAGWNLQSAAEDLSKKDQVYQISCPYKQMCDCDKVWTVAHSELNCHAVRCGLNVWMGKEYQFPRHGSRQDVLRHLQSWPGWEDWPGAVHGCGRPFRFPDPGELKHGDGESENFGIFLTWDDKTGGTLEEVLAADPAGDYSRVAP